MWIYRKLARYIYPCPGCGRSFRECPNDGFYLRCPRLDKYVSKLFAKDTIHNVDI